MKRGLIGFSRRSRCKDCWLVTPKPQMDTDSLGDCVNAVLSAEDESFVTTDPGDDQGQSDVALTAQTTTFAAVHHPLRSRR